MGATADAILVSDYGYGTVTPRVYETRASSPRAQAPVQVDSRYELPRFPGVTAATPNEPELEAAHRRAEWTTSARREGGARRCSSGSTRGILLVTRGSRGMALLERDGPVTFIPIHGTDEIADVTGAGDTVISTFTAALAAGAAPVRGGSLANVAGGVVVMKRGTATVTVPELAGRARERWRPSPQR